MAQHDPPFGKPLGLSKKHEIQRPDRRHGGARDAQEKSQVDEAETGHRQHEMTADVESPCKSLLARGDGFYA
ncbi:hypothetical protein D3C72_1722070 [compost metagenome]